MISGPVAIFVLGALAVGGLLWVFVYPYLSGEAQAEKRMATLSVADVAESRRKRRDDGTASKRKQVEDSLKELEQREKNAKRPPLATRISQAGLSISKQQFIMFSVGTGVVCALAMLVGGMSPLLVLGAGFVGGFGIPRWLLAKLKQRRERKFHEAFPTAVDVVVRGVKAGLPLGDCLNIVANEADEPVKAEFRAIVETQALGIPLHEAVMRLYERIPVPEANFFGIVISIQQKSGGNLSEVLGNLSKVLRDRKKMKAKIIALSSEAKASAMIIAALPISVMGLVYMTSPQYIELLWTTPIGRVMLFCCVVWMSLGVLVMRRMINFDF